MNYTVENTQPSDLNFIYHLFDEAIVYQKKRGYPVWPAYDKEVLVRDIAEQNQFKIVIDSKIVCIFSICYSDKIVWREQDKGNAIYLHRIVVNPTSKGLRHFGKILDWTKLQARIQGLSFIRMDTWANNPTIINYYRSFGFEIVDSFVTPNHEDLPIQQRGNAIVLLEFSIQ